MNQLAVEVRFAVENREDFTAFQKEAEYVYTYFKHRPIVSCGSTFNFTEIPYDVIDIIPGVSSVKYVYRENKSYAVMGNIAYPIDIPQAKNALGELEALLRCDLVMHFDIGELDFQASREGLSYIPQTIDAIKTKLEKLNGQLINHITAEANAIDNHWERAHYLGKRAEYPLWSNAVNQYIKDTSFQLRTGRSNKLELNIESLAIDFNISLTAFRLSWNGTQKLASQHSRGGLHWGMVPTMKTMFVINDTKTGAGDRAKYHINETPEIKNNLDYLWIISAVDKNNPMDTDGFFNLICNPPKEIIMLASSLKKRTRTVATNLDIGSILKLVERRYTSSRWSTTSKMVWEKSINLENTDPSTTYYYVPLSGLTSLGLAKDIDMTYFHDIILGSGIFTGDLYGVRKDNLETIKTLSNWVHIDDYIVTQLEKLNKTNVMGLVKFGIDFDAVYRYSDIYNKINVNSPYIKLFNIFKDHKTVFNKSKLDKLNAIYNIDKSNVINLIDMYKKEINAILERYPLLKILSRDTEGQYIAEYINAIDNMKGI